MYIHYYYHYYYIYIYIYRERDVINIIVEYIISHLSIGRGAAGARVHGGARAGAVMVLIITSYY